MRSEEKPGIWINIGDWSEGVHLTVNEKIAALRLLKECSWGKACLALRRSFSAKCESNGREIRRYSKY